MSFFKAKRKYLKLKKNCLLIFVLSLRLTAFVTRVFHEAKRHIYVDDDVIIKAINWIMDKQSKNGSFPEPGRVIHKNMQVIVLTLEDESIYYQLCTFNLIQVILSYRILYKYTFCLN